MKSTDEQEADTFAAETLIPSNVYAKFLITGGFSEQAIRKFASQQQIHTGIVVGRLKNNELLPFTAMHHLHRKVIVKGREAEEVSYVCVEVTLDNFITSVEGAIFTYYEIETTVEAI